MATLKNPFAPANPASSGAKAVSSSGGTGGGLKSPFQQSNAPAPAPVAPAAPQPATGPARPMQPVTTQAFATPQPILTQKLTIEAPKPAPAAPVFQDHGAVISQAPKDNRPVDTPLARLGRAVLPEALQKEFGIAESQRQPAPVSPGDQERIAGAAITKQEMAKNPEKVSTQEYFRSGLSFGHNLNLLGTLEGPTAQPDIEDLPEPATKEQSFAKALGSIVSMTLAQPLIEGAATSVISKIPGGANALKFIADYASKFPWLVGYPLTIAKSGAEGALFGLITKNKQSVAKNVLDTAGTFAAFSALAYPIQTFFKPIIQSVGSVEGIPPGLKNILTDPKLEATPGSDVIWFKNPKDPNQFLKVTGSGVDFVSSDAGLAPGVQRSAPVLTKVEIEAFEKQPSIYEKLKDWASGKIKSGSVPFEGQVPEGAVKVENATPEPNGSGTPVEPAAPVSPVVSEPGGIPQAYNDRAAFTGAESPLKNSDFAILTAENPGGTAINTAENKRRNQSLVTDLRAMGYEPIPVVGHYGGNPENSFIVPGLSEEDAISLGKKYGQESVLTPKGLIYQDGTVNPADTSKINFKSNQQDYYSEIKIGGKKVKFSIPIDFEKKLPLDSLKGFEFDHYSTTPNLTELKPEFQGTGAAGSEKPYQQYPEFQAKGVYLYPKGAEPEKVVLDKGGHKYSGKVRGPLLELGSPEANRISDEAVRLIEEAGDKYGKGNQDAMNAAFLHIAKVQGYKGIVSKKGAFYFDNISGLTNTPKEAPAEVPQESPAEAKAPAPGGALASGGGKPIGDFENLEETLSPESTPEKEFKLFQKVEELIKKYAKTIGEGYLPRNARGVYYPDTENIRVNGMNNVSTAAHEIAHFLDISKTQISKKFIEGTKASDPLRKALTDLYVEYYGGGRQTHALKKRVVEGFATLLQKYVEMPSTIEAKYPGLVEAFLKKGGKFYEPVFGDILKDLRGIVSEYQGLDPLDKIGARITRDNSPIGKKSFMNIGDHIRTEAVDNLFPIEKLAKMSGTHFTKDDPSLWARAYTNTGNSIVANNMTSKHNGYWAFRNGEFVKLHDFNWKTLVNKLEGDKTSDSFAHYLVARREYFGYERLKELAQAIKVWERMPSAIKGKMKLENPQKFASMTEQYKGFVEEREALQEILKNDGITETEASEAYLKNKDRFKAEEDIFDTLTNEDLQFLKDPEVQLIDPAQYERLSSQKGYASFKRQFYDDIAGQDEGFPATGGKVGKTKVSSLIGRKGSMRTIVDPVLSAMQNHAEMTKKGIKQITYNKILGVADQFPELFQPQQLKVVPRDDGSMTFPQDKDPDIVMARRGYKRVPLLTDRYIKKILDEGMNPQGANYFVQMLTGANRIFTKGTTGLFPGFALTNYVVDQFSAAAQSRNNYIPIYTALAEFAKILQSPKEGEASKYFMEYLTLGGERQTLVGWQDMSAKELFEKIANERKGILKLIDAMDTGMNLLGKPSEWSEIATRASEYVRARQAGKSQIVALEEAGRVTAPFHHVGRLGGGNFGRGFIKSIPFFNPALQVLDQVARTAETPAGRKRQAFVTLAVTSMLLGSFAYLYGKASEKQKQQYLDLQPSELAMYLWLPKPGGDGLIRIKLPQEMAVFGALANMVMADKFMGAHYTAGDYFDGATAWLPNQLNPNPLEWQKTFFAWIPQLLKPAIELAANVKDFPKILPLEGASASRLPSQQRVTPSTSAFAKWLGNTKIAEKLDLSPIQIDFLITGYLGRASGLATGKLSAYNPLNSLNSDYYFTSGRRVEKYYELKNQNDQDFGALQKNTGNFSLQERKNIIIQHGILSRIDNYMAAFRKVDLAGKPDSADHLRIKITQLLQNL